jgi:malate/lactate dehydrogenase
MEKALTGVRAELHDCAFPLLEDVVCTSDQSVGFKDIDYAFMVGSKPRMKGMERADLLKDNG